MVRKLKFTRQRESLLLFHAQTFKFTFFISQLSSGSFQDYVYGSLQVKYAFAVELRDEGHFGFLLPPFLIEPTARELFEGLKAMVREMKFES